RQTPPYHLQALQHAARSRGVELAVFGVNGPEEIASAIDAAKAAGAEALNFLATPLFSLPGTRNNTVVMERIAACGCRRSSNGPNPGKRVRLQATARGLPKCTVKGHVWSPRYCVAPSPPMFRSSNLLISNW